MTTRVLYDPISSSAYSTDWIPLEDLTGRWAAFAASALTPRASAAVASAFRALSHERLALRRLTRIVRTRRTLPPLVPPRPATWFDEAVSERECVLSCLQEGTQQWGEVAHELAWHLHELLPELDEDARRTGTALLADALAQRLRLTRLMTEVLAEQTACFPVPTLPGASFDGEVQP